MTPLLRLRGDLDRLRKSKGARFTDDHYDLRAARETARQWLEDPSGYQKVDLDILSRLLFAVYDQDPEKFLNLRIKDVFRLVNPDNSP